MNSEEYCIAHGEMWRAIIVLVGPMAMIGYTAFHFFVTLDYRPADFVKLMMTGELNPFVQLMGFLALAFWYWLLTAPIMETLKSGGRLISVSGADLVMADGRRIPLASVTGAWQENRVIAFDIVIGLDDGSRHKISWGFLRETPDSVVERILERAERAKRQGLPSIAVDALHESNA